MRDTTYTYNWALKNGLGRVAPLSIKSLDYETGLVIEKWFYFSESSGKLKIKSKNGEWKDFIEGIEIDGIRFISAIRPVIDNYTRTFFDVKYEHIYVPRV